MDGVRRRHRVAGWANRRLLVRHGWAIWFSQEQRMPDDFSPDDEPQTYTLVATGPIRMRLGRYRAKVAPGGRSWRMGWMLTPTFWTHHP